MAIAKQLIDSLIETTRSNERLQARVERLEDELKEARRRAETADVELRLASQREASLYTERKELLKNLERAVAEAKETKGQRDAMALHAQQLTDEAASIRTELLSLQHQVMELERQRLPMNETVTREEAPAPTYSRLPIIGIDQG